MSGWVSPGGPACRLAASHLQGPARLTTHELDHLLSLVAPNVPALGHQCVHRSAEGPPAPFPGRRPAGRLQPTRQLRPRVRQVARQLVEVDEGLGNKDELDPALQLLEAEPALGVVLVQLGGKTFPICIRGPRSTRPAAFRACAHGRGL